MRLHFYMNTLGKITTKRPSGIYLAILSITSAVRSLFTNKARYLKFNLSRKKYLRTFFSFYGRWNLI